MGVKRPGAGSASADPRWRAARLLGAPYRAGFVAGGALYALTGVWWLAVLAARACDIALPWRVAPPLAHGLAMALGYMPAFVAGFLFTAAPRWLGRPAVDARTLVGPLAGLAGGAVLALVGFHARAPLAAAGVALVAAGWARIAIRFGLLLRASQAPDRSHAKVIALASAAGAAALAAAAFGLAAADARVVRSATQLALWAFLMPVYATVSQRIVPQPEVRALRRLDGRHPQWLWFALLGVFMFEAVCTVAAPWVDTAPAVVAAQAAIELPVGAGLLALAWHGWRSRRPANRLLSMLHAGSVWQGVAFALAGISHASVAAGAAGLGLAPLHALTMGYMGTTLFAIATRLVATHGGRSVAIDRLAWRWHLVLQAAVVLRIGAAFAPALAQPLGIAAAAAWAGCALFWAVRHAAWMGRPRIDGRGR